MSFFKDSRNRTFFTIILSAIIVAASIAGGNWRLGYADTTPTIPIPISIDPDTVHVNSAGFRATITGSDFVGILYTKVFFKNRMARYMNLYLLMFTIVLLNIVVQH